MAALYTCSTVRDLLIRLTGQIGSKIYGRGATIGNWQAGTPRGNWPDGQGTTLNNLMWERTVPADLGTEWVTPSVSDNSTIDNCIVAPETLRFGQTQRSMTIQKRHIQTEEICFEDIRSSFLFEQFLRKLQQNLSFVTNYVWDSRDRDEYLRLCDHKLTENETFDINATSTSVNSPPTRKLSWGTLEMIWDQLEAEGAGMDGVTMGVSGASSRPVFDFYTDGQTMRDLLRDEDALRQDFRYAYEGQGVNSPLLKMRGGEFAFNGFRFVNDSNQRRFDIVGGVKVNRPKYADPVAATKGVKQEVNPSWLYAKYKTSAVHIPAVYTQLVLDTKGPVAGMPFNAVNWNGDFEFLVILDKVCNPRGNKGFFDALFASASEPGLTQLGWSIDHLNCGPTRTAHNCYS